MRISLLPCLALSLFLIGCGGRPTEKRSGGDATTKPAAGAMSEEEKEIQDNLAKLSPEDRKLAEAQKYCVVQDDSLLGSMDVPIKVMVKGQPVFLCCGHCKKKALADPDKTLAKVKALKEKNAGSGGK